MPLTGRLSAILLSCARERSAGRGTRPRDVGWFGEFHAASPCPSASTPRDPGPAPPRLRDPPAPRRPRAAGVRARGRERPGADLVDAGRRAALAREPARGGRCGRGRRARRRDALRRARGARCARLGGHRPRRHPQRRDEGRGRGIRRPSRRADRPLPRRVHRPRPLRRARRPRPCRQRRDPRCGTRRWRSSRRAPAPSCWA